jgi:hypothetical protein
MNTYISCIPKKICLQLFYCHFYDQSIQFSEKELILCMLLKKVNCSELYVIKNIYFSPHV